METNIKNIYNSIKKWWRGKLVPYSIGEAFDLHNQNRKWGIKPKPIHGRFDPPFIARILNPAWQFWLRRWPILLPIIVGAIIALFIHFDSKSNSKPPQKQDRMPTVHADK